MRGRRPITALLCAAAAAGLALASAGCGGRGRKPVELVPEETISPVVRGAETGLESRLWVVENGGGALARAMREFGPPPTATPGSVELWRRNGFRVLGVPVARLDELRDRLPTIGPLHRQWLGVLPEWVEVVKGAEFAADRPVALDNGPVRLGPGRLRLVSRCWAVPSVGALPDGSATGAVLRLEVMPELEMREAGLPLERLLAEPSTSSGSAGRSGVQGIAFDRLLLGMVASGEWALVIVPEDPRVDWDAALERPEADPPAGEGVSFGPRPPAVPTLGELMLTSLALPESVGDARIVVVLVPRAPETFELLPR